MNVSKPVFMAVAVAATLSLVAIEVWAQGPRRQGRGPMFRGGRLDAQFRADHEVFHFLLANHKDVRRTVTERGDGVETLTESDDPQIAAKIQHHVAAMYTRVKERRPIRRRDPLFDELFRHADKIQMQLENTEKGVKVVETSKDPYVVRLIQEHARVVSLFAENGYAEARKNHKLPAATRSTSWNGKIVQHGKLHQVLAEGQHQGRIKLGELIQKPHCHAVGALAGLSGEVTIVDGRIVASRVAETGLPLAPPKPPEQAATMIAAAYVPTWREQKIDRDIAPDEFEQFLRKSAADAGLNPARPFPFTIEGALTALEMHVINGACPIRAKTLGEKLPKSQQPYRGSVKQVKAQLVGFHAEDSVGDLTCHGAAAHTHVVLQTEDGRSYTGHVESVGIKAGSVLRLPK